MALSLLQAFKAKQTGNISWDEYMHVLLSRYAGVKHKDDEAGGKFHTALRRTDGLGHMIYMSSNRLATPMSDIAPLEAVFKAYRYDSLDEVKRKLVLLDGQPRECVNGVKKSLAMLACQERRADVLEYCLNALSFPLESSFIDEVDKVDSKKDPKTFGVLRSSSMLSSDRDWDDWARQQEENRDINGDIMTPIKPGVFDQGTRLPVDW